ncbi:transcription-repair coupling factor [Synoicihabitans lomoniglobus]|uniref:Transcription-repair-coupling factor n=1 Tax=Synoicihabitans lomoniglobus TaxID=2909285 RepID=A0AAF0CRY1_9BACT|nr:transcription-repair coupling factor [Opitutaceae bacterium LMO-M01]WED66933.1 transcription-repair coupling factor [Opitutaceae bacterium LMO-M01]
MSVSASRPQLTGVCPPARGAVLAQHLRDCAAPVWLVVAPDLKIAEQLAEDIAFFAEASGHSPLPGILVLPESMPTDGDMREAFAASADRTTVLSRLRATRGVSKLTGGKVGPLVVITFPAALIQPVPALESFARNELELKPGNTLGFDALLAKLHELDYDSEPLCESPGHYAVRGGLIDVYPITANEPYRLDFFGDELEEIRAFDPVSQRSGATVPKITLSASPRLKLDPARTGLADYLSPATRLIFIEPAELEARFSTLAADRGDAAINPVISALLDRSAALAAVQDLDEASFWFESSTGPEHTWNTESLVHYRRYPGDGLVAQERLHAESEARHEFLAQLVTWQREGYAIHIVTAKSGEEDRTREILAEESGIAALKPTFDRGALNEGFRLTFRDDATLTWRGFGKKTRGLVMVTETEIFGRSRPRRPSLSQRALVQRAQVDQLLDFADLVEGDFVVHLQHGIAHYRGLTKIETRDGVREVISLEFDDHVTLHVPLQESHLISRYVGLSKSKPQLGRIGTARWEKARKAAERSTVDLAAELLRLQAARDAEPGFAHPPDTTWQQEFESSFPYTETPDQLRAIDEAKADLERSRPMDRLICGDVGFGKTEVAIRAAFKAVQGGKQVAILIPTTVLAQQHLNSFRERMAGYPIAVEMVSRFRTRKEQTSILAATAAGQVDILIGTHRLLQKDVKFKDLGLVIIDEEQRFGVKHKERFKAMRASIDVMAMSATPIPRTLYMALTGARDMSVIETAPTNRHPIQTIVKTYDDKLVVDAVRREVARGGQVFYLHNRVQTIEVVAAHLAELMPEIKIGVGHGQMDEKTLEKRMTDFVAGDYQLLVCTTIIESGLDIPNCNTIIIEGADRFGLSQLYQLRGRVGRFKHQAYAYLLLHRHTRLVEIARERLSAMRTHNQLGAGFRIAMRDLELRGAGNLLGSEQSGHIVGVGFELYCQLLRQSVARLKGEKQATSIRATVKLDFVFVGDGAAGGADRGRHRDGYTAIRDAEHAASGAVAVAHIQARLPADYIGETRLRIDFYRRLAMAGSLDELKQLQSDLRDRFGKFGEPVKALLLVTEIRIRAEQKGIVSVETQSTKLKCLRASGQSDDWVMHGARFPRLTAPKPLLRLREISTFLDNLPHP